jgi:hypothetical protein
MQQNKKSGNHWSVIFFSQLLIDIVSIKTEKWLVSCSIHSWRRTRAESPQTTEDYVVLDSPLLKGLSKLCYALKKLHLQKGTKL